MSREFVEMVGRRLSPGYAAVLAEAIEDDPELLDRRMSGIGGKVLRESRAEVADEPMFNELSQRKAELESLKAEHASASVDSKRTLQQRIDEAQARIGELADRARNRVEAEQQELDAKIRLLETTAATASGDRRSRLVQTIEDLRAERERRSAKPQETVH
jgi:DNA repair exonuclease SbcCD ATPase subunit